MMIEVTPIYAALIAILMAVLSTWVGALRGIHGVALGGGPDKKLSLFVRRFGNLSEYAAMTIIILLLMELKGIEAQWLHTYGITLITLRLIHPIILFDNMNAPMWKKAGRFISASGTALLLLIGSASILLA